MRVRVAGDTVTFSTSGKDQRCLYYFGHVTSVSLFASFCVERNLDTIRDTCFRWSLERDSLHGTAGYSVMMWSAGEEGASLV